MDGREHRWSLVLANGRLWPKADLRNRAFWGVLMSGFGKSGHPGSVSYP